MGLEPTTFGFGIRCSTFLSYGPLKISSFILLLYVLYVFYIVCRTFGVPVFLFFCVYFWLLNSFSAHILCTQVLLVPVPYQSSISVTTPAPTVFPPSLIAKRIPLSIAAYSISSIVSSTLSPGITISTPCGRVISPVISAVLI